MNCPLCLSFRIDKFISDKTRDYLKCKNCDLVFVSPEDRLSELSEKKRYDLHDNTYTNKGYVKYLTKIVDLVESLNIEKPLILDFGCGKEAVLEKLLSNYGYQCFSYDPLYNLGLDFNNFKFDIVVISEVMEHIFNPYDALQEISDILRNKASVILRTELFPGDKEFLHWWYKEDPAHVSFFSLFTIEKAADLLGCSVILSTRNIFILRKN